MYPAVASKESQTIHPVIQIICFIVLAGFLSMASIHSLIIGGCLIILLYLLTDLHHLKSAMLMVRRMRWFFLSLLIMFFWFTPGQHISIPLVEGSVAWLPTVEGVQAGVERIVSLILIILAVNLLLRNLTQQQLFAAIYWLAWPLEFLGDTRNRLAVRMVLIIGVLSEVQGVVREGLASRTKSSHNLTNISNIAASLFELIIKEAESVPCQTIELPSNQPPSYFQWSYPIILFLILFVSVDFL